MYYVKTGVVSNCCVNACRTSVELKFSGYKAGSFCLPLPSAYSAAGTTPRSTSRPDRVSISAVSPTKLQAYSKRTKKKGSKRKRSGKTRPRIYENKLVNLLTQGPVENRSPNYYSVSEWNNSAIASANNNAVCQFTKQRSGTWNSSFSNVEPSKMLFCSRTPLNQLLPFTFLLLEH